MMYNNNIDNDIEIVRVTEFCKRSEPIKKKFTDEVRIIETEFNDKLEVLYTSNGEHAIRTMQHVGYIILPNHIISISSKIHDISFINMVRYALQLPELKPEHLNVSDEKQPNYYDCILATQLTKTT